MIYSAEKIRDICQIIKLQFLGAWPIDYDYDYGPWNCFSNKARARVLLWLSTLKLRPPLITASFWFLFDLGLFEFVSLSVSPSYFVSTITIYDMRSPKVVGIHSGLGSRSSSKMGQIDLFLVNAWVALIHFSGLLMHISSPFTNNI